MNPASSEASTASTEKTESGAAMQTPGAMLEHERARQGLSVQQASEGMNLDAWIVEAIEANRFLALGAPVYAKGYLRKYAAMLGLAPDVIVARYETLTDTLPEPTPIPVITTTPPPRPKWPKYLGWGVLAAVVVGIAIAALPYVLPEPESTRAIAQPSDTAPTLPPATVAPAAEAPMQQTATQQAATAPASVESATAPVRASTAERPAEAPTPATEVSEESRSATPGAASGETLRLTLSFSNASWAEVYDAAGQRLFYDIGQAGRARTVTGTAPLNVVIGVADAVTLQVNERDIVVPRRANRDSARFVVNADGSVR